MCLNLLPYKNRPGSNGGIAWGIVGGFVSIELDIANAALNGCTHCSNTDKSCDEIATIVT
jgi:hypothetical protein